MQQKPYKRQLQIWDLISSLVRRSCRRSYPFIIVKILVILLLLILLLLQPLLHQRPQPLLISEYDVLIYIPFVTYVLIWYFFIYRWNNQNWESNEIDDVSNHIDSNSVYQFRPNWHTSTAQPAFMTWTKPSSKQPPFITKPKPWYTFTNKYPQTETTTTNKYHTHRPFTSTTISSTTTTTTTTTTSEPTTLPTVSSLPMQKTPMNLVSASTTDKKTRK